MHRRTDEIVGPLFHLGRHLPCRRTADLPQLDKNAHRRSSGELQVEARMSGPIAFSIRKLHASPTRAASAVGVRPDSPETERLEKFYGNQLKICISFVLRFPQARRA